MNAPAHARYSRRLIAALAVMTVIYTLAYLAHPSLPGNDAGFPLAWWGWNDQGLYLRAAKALANLDFRPSEYNYPIGYPALAAPFVRLMPMHAFFPASLAFSLLAFAGLALLASRFGLRGVWWWLGLFACIGLPHVAVMQESFVVPWNTIPVQGMLLAALAALGFAPWRRGLRLWLPFAVGATLLFRPVDAVLFLPVWLAALATCADMRQRLAFTLRTSLVVAAFVMLWAGFNLAVFRHVLSDYERHSATIGFGSFSILEKLGYFLVDSNVFFREPKANFVAVSWPLLFCLPGFARLWRKHRPLGLALLGTVLVNFALYLAYNDFWPENFLLYRLVHYVAFVFPLAFLVMVYGLWGMWRQRRAELALSLILALAPLAAVSLARIDETQIGGLPEARLNAQATSPSVAYDGFEVPGVKYLFIGGLAAYGELMINDKPLTRFRDYFIMRRDGGTAILLTKATDLRSVSFTPRSPDEAAKNLAVSKPDQHPLLLYSLRVRFPVFPPSFIPSKVSP